MGRRTGMRGNVGKCVGEVRRDVGKGEGGDVGKCGRKCVGAPHPNTLPYTLPIPLPTSFPHTPTHFPTHPMHSPTHLPHSFDYVAKLPRDDVTSINLTGLWKSPVKFFMTTGNLKSCFDVGNVR